MVSISRPARVGHSIPTPCVSAARASRPSAMQRVGIIGGGAWGTALAQVLRRAGREVVIWVRESEVVAAINESHANPLFLPEIALDPGIVATAALDVAARADVLLLTTPAQHLRAICVALAPHVNGSMPVVICTK